MAEPKDSKQISLTINKLTQAQYEELSSQGKLSSELSDQLFMTTDDGRVSPKGSSIVVEPILTSGVNVANITVDDKQFELYSPDDYVSLSGDNRIVGSNEFTNIYAIQNLLEEKNLSNTTLMVNSGNKSYNVTFAEFAKAISSFYPSPLVEITVNFYKGVTTELISSITMPAGSMIELPNAGGLEFDESSEYVFAYWTDSDGNRFNNTTVFNSNTNVYARWSYSGKRICAVKEQDDDSGVGNGWTKVKNNTEKHNAVLYPGIWRINLAGAKLTSGVDNKYGGGHVQWRQLISNAQSITYSLPPNLQMHSDPPNGHADTKAEPLLPYARSGTFNSGSVPTFKSGKGDYNGAQNIIKLSATSAGSSESNSTKSSAEFILTNGLESDDPGVTDIILV